MQQDEHRLHREPYLDPRPPLLAPTALWSAVLSSCPKDSQPRSAGSPTPPRPRNAAPSRRPGDSGGSQGSLHRNPETLSHLPQPQAHMEGPSSPQLQQDQYWAYVADAHKDMAPGEFRGFIHAIGPPPRVVTQEARLLTTRPPKVERPKLTQPHRL